MTFQVAETFNSIQGEGLFTGAPMLFIRFVGCSVGKKICQHCDTDFDKTYPWHGGGEFTEQQIKDLLYRHQAHRICFTGGEPFDQPELGALLWELKYLAKIHIESSGTVEPAEPFPWHLIEHLCISPKPGYKLDMIDRADEVKVIVGGLGIGPGWPTLDDAKKWATLKPVFLQPRNKKLDVDIDAIHLAQQLCESNPELRLSVQLHKVLRVR